MNSVYNDVEYVVEASQNFLKQVQNSHKGKLSTPTQNHGRTNAPQHGLHRSQNDDAQSPFSTEMNSYQQTPTNESFHTYTPTQRSYKQPNMNGKFRPQNAPDQYRFSQPQQTQQMYQQQFQQRSVQRMPTQHTPVQYGYPSHSSSPYTPQVDYNHMAPSRGPVYYDRQVPVMSGPMQFMPAMYPPSPDQYGYPNNGTFQQVFSPPMQMQPRQIIGSFEASSRHNGVPEDPRQTRQISSDSTPHHNSSPLRQSSQEKMHSQERDDYDRQQDLYESYTSPTLRRSGLAQAQTDELPGPGLSFGLGVVDPPTHSGYDDSNRYVSVNEKRNHSLSPPLDSPPGLTAQGDISSLMQTMKISPEDNSFGRRLNTVID